MTDDRDVVGDDDEARTLAVHLLHDAVERGAPEARWMRGGFWRAFQVNYREINDLHKQMLRTSRTVEDAAPGVDEVLAFDLRATDAAASITRTASRSSASTRAS